MLVGLLLTLHVLAVVIWIGGMFFAHNMLRPAAMLLEPPQRLTLWRQVFKRFFAWVWISIIVLLASGVGLIVLYGGMGNVHWSVHAMLTVGIIMIALFSYLFFAPYRQFRQSINIQDFPAAGEQLAKIRFIVTINLVLGLITTVIAAIGKYLPL
ncbi:CopD family protein [Candidatus Albibeggiatoa sp. nov. NOAA]|uniref:CopD family protein n=1 Tax=Candidatus Albibeggiatoa sp. nov. NOAA TaxID=3162724 RepID=UPI0032F2EB96|nr:CopD family protein [Thiotrichaceae bacterium]